MPGPYGHAMAAILVIRPVPFEWIFKQLLPGGCIWNLSETGPAVSEEKPFEKVDEFDSIDNTDKRPLSIL